MKRKAGFTMLMAVVVTSMLLIISFAVVNVALKQMVIANMNEESQYAFYTADSGIECAVYWDFKNGVSAFDISTPSNISCNNQSFNVGGVATSTFTINYGNRCVTVSVGKHSNGLTIIDSRGYNTCVPSAARKLERGQTLMY